MAKVAIIGAGFSGISAAAYLSGYGHEVHVFEKNQDAGGRARQLFTEEGYIFDMGPSWYWMPEVFEQFFKDFGHSPSDFYNLSLLDPSFEIVFDNNKVKIPAGYQDLCQVFELIEKGSSHQLTKFLQEAEYKYKTGIQDLAYKPGLSINEFADFNLLKGIYRLQVFSSFSSHVRRFFSHPQLITLMEFPVLFLGAMPKETPALYSLMNYAGLKLGTYYPEGGFGSVVKAMVQIAENNSTRFHFGREVNKIISDNNNITHLIINNEKYKFDGVIAAADYNHVEENLLEKNKRNYNYDYWEGKTLAPSSLIYYIGLNKKIKNIEHHTLFFDEDFNKHAIDIYKNPQWPEKPLFYVCCPSKTDRHVAPTGHENLFLLMPIAPGLSDTEELRERYFQIIWDRLEKHCAESLKENIVFKKSYCINNFISDYYSYKGNAYGLANTLSQTALLKPKIKNKKLKNLYYAGQLTVPGPGVPPAIISGKIAAGLLSKHLKSISHEVNV